MKKTAIVLALGLAFGVAASANAAVVTGITVKDVGSTLVGGIYSPILDTRSGGFRFNVIDPVTYFGASKWTGDVGTGKMLGQGAANPAGSFTTGFLFTGTPFVPYTFGAGFNADITGGTLTVSSLDFGGQFGGTTNFNLPPDPGTLKVNWVNQVGTAANDYNVSFQWSHVITAAEDPSGGYVGFNARWIVEGVAHTASVVPVPAAAWLLGSGLVGLVGVARRRKSV